MFCNARSYIGTLFMISTSEAHDVIVKLLERHFDKTLPHGLWSAQREVYQTSIRRPYVVTGVYPQRLRPSRGNAPFQVINSISTALSTWRKRLLRVDNTNVQKTRALKEIIAFHERELKWYRERWLTPSRPVDDRHAISRFRVSPNTTKLRRYQGSGNGEATTTSA
jgi:hypothetical protein